MPIRAQKSGEVHILGVIKLGEINRMIVSSGISDLFNNGRKLVLSFFILFFLPSVSLAATESFTGHGEYIMDNNDSIKHGQDIALREAIRNVAQQATVAMKSQSGTIDNHVYNDEVDMATVAIMQINDKTLRQEIATDGKIIVKATIQATLDVERAEQMAVSLLEVKNTTKDYEKVLAEYGVAESQYNLLQAEFSSMARLSAKQQVYEGIKLERQERIAEAMALYEKAIAEDVNLAMAYSRRGHIYRQRELFDLAQKDYDKAAVLDPQEAGAHYGNAILLERNGKNTEATEEYRLFIKYSDILEYDKEIPIALDKILGLEQVREPSKAEVQRAVQALMGE